MRRFVPFHSLFCGIVTVLALGWIAGPIAANQDAQAPALGAPTTAAMRAWPEDGDPALIAKLARREDLTLSEVETLSESAAGPMNARQVEFFRASAAKKTRAQILLRLRRGDVAVVVMRHSDGSNTAAGAVRLPATGGPEKIHGVKYSHGKRIVPDSLFSTLPMAK